MIYVRNKLRGLKALPATSWAKFAVITLLVLGNGALLYMSYGSSLSLGNGPDPATEDPVAFRSMQAQDKLKILRAMGVSSGSTAVYDFLKRAYPDEPGSEHELVHVVGETAFKESGYAAFKVCDSFFRYGCYHGVILQAIKEKGGGDDTLKALGEGCKTLDKNRTSITACIHGIGHGLMVVRSYDIFAAYKDCDRMFTDSLDLFFCYDGVSMENVVRRFEEPNAVNDLESSDPFYPCDKVDDKYQPACVREHLHNARRVFYDKDTSKTAKNYCEHWTLEQSKTECFGALGNAINQDNPDDPQKNISECGKVEPKYRQYCIGVAATQYAFSRQFEKADVLCDSLSGNEKTGCHYSIDAAKNAL